MIDIDPRNLVGKLAVGSAAEKPDACFDDYATSFLTASRRAKETGKPYLIVQVVAILNPDKTALLGGRTPLLVSCEV